MAATLAPGRDPVNTLKDANYADQIARQVDYLTVPGAVSPAQLARGAVLPTGVPGRTLVVKG
jgi:hypothetical protein